MTNILPWNWTVFPIEKNKYISTVVIPDESDTEKIPIRNNSLINFPDHYLSSILQMYPSAIYVFNDLEKLPEMYNKVYVKDMKMLYENEYQLQEERKASGVKGKTTIFLDFRKLDFGLSELVYLQKLFDLSHVHVLAVGRLKDIPHICFTNSQNIFFFSMNYFNKYSQKLKLEQIDSSAKYVLIADFTGRDMLIYAEQIPAN